MQTNVRFGHSVANIRRPASYFESAGLRFDVIPDDSGLGDMILAIIRFHSGQVALIGTRPTHRDLGVELFSQEKASATFVLRALREEFPDIRDEDVQITRC